MIARGQHTLSDFHLWLLDKPDHILGRLVRPAYVTTGLQIAVASVRTSRPHTERHKATGSRGRFAQLDCLMELVDIFDDMIAWHHED